MFLGVPYFLEVFFFFLSLPKLTLPCAIKFVYSQALVFVGCTLTQEKTTTCFIPLIISLVHNSGKSSVPATDQMLGKTR